MLETLATLGWMIAAALAARVFWPGFTEYGKAKGKNLADKEDIAQLTKLVEDVKHENAEILEQIRARQQMRLAAASERLKAHQEAFQLWRKMLRALYKPEIVALVQECDDWWEGNCLYLSAEAREAFMDAMLCASQHKTVVGQVKDANTARIMKDIWDKVFNAGPVIVEAVQLPSLGEREAEVPKES